MVKKDVIKKVRFDVDSYIHLMETKPEFKESWYERACGVVSFAYSTLEIISIDEFSKLTSMLSDEYIK